MALGGQVAEPKAAPLVSAVRIPAQVGLAHAPTSSSSTLEG